MTGLPIVLTAVPRSRRKLAQFVDLFAPEHRFGHHPGCRNRGCSPSGSKSTTRPSTLPRIVHRLDSRPASVSRLRAQASIVVSTRAPVVLLRPLAAGSQDSLSGIVLRNATSPPLVSLTPHWRGRYPGQGSAYTLGSGGTQHPFPLHNGVVTSSCYGRHGNSTERHQKPWSDHG